MKATHKWALTGTPIQNTLDDIYSLIAFLELDPWADYTWWNRMVARHINKNVNTAINIVRKLLKPLMLRRTKNTVSLDGKKLIDLPSLKIETMYITMSADEREIYEQMYVTTRSTVITMLREGTVSHNITSIFEMLLRLRQFCDHPFLVMRKGVVEVENLDCLLEWVNVSNEYIPQLRSTLLSADIECPVCLDSIFDTILTKCGHILCKQCAVSQIGYNANCPICKCSLSHMSIKKVPKKNRFASSTESFEVSSKIELLLHLLTSVQESTVIYSQWTGMLDIVGYSLSLSSIEYSRLDGSMNKQQRAEAIKLFKTSTNLILISLKAGGVGLNLCHASRVILLDPWWNPAVELQAIQRVHRIGQTRPVTAIKMVCVGTIEEKMLKLQQMKQELVEGAYSEAVCPMNLENLKMMFQDV